MLPAVAQVILHRLGGTKKALAACRLVEGLYRSGRRVVVWLAEERKAEIFHEYLWTFAEESFVPHGLWREAGAEEEPVVVASGPLTNPNRAQALVLLDPPPQLAGLEEFAEIHDLLSPLPADAGRVEAWRAAGFTVREARPVAPR